MAGAFMLGIFISGLDCFPASTFSHHCSWQDGKSKQEMLDMHGQHVEVCAK